MLTKSKVFCQVFTVFLLKAAFLFVGKLFCVLQMRTLVVSLRDQECEHHGSMFVISYVLSINNRIDFIINAIHSYFFNSHFILLYKLKVE